MDTTYAHVNRKLFEKNNVKIQQKIGIRANSTFSPLEKGDNER